MTLEKELCVDPGPRVRAAHLTVLRGSGGALPGSAAQDVPSFTGRERELALLDGLLARAADARPGGDGRAVPGRVGRAQRPRRSVASARRGAPTPRAANGRQGPQTWAMLTDPEGNEFCVSR